MGNKETIGYTCLAHKLGPGTASQTPVPRTPRTLYAYPSPSKISRQSSHARKYISTRSLHHAIETYRETLIKLSHTFL